MGCMMLYPNIINIKRSNIAIKILLGISIIIVAVCILINELTTPQIKWAFLVAIRNYICMDYNIIRGKEKCKYCISCVFTNCCSLNIVIFNR